MNSLSNNSSDEDSTDEEEVMRDFDAEAKFIIEKNTLPKKSEDRYLLVYDAFMKWRTENNANSFAENILIVYFKELQGKLKPPTLWSIWSMLKKTLSTKENVAIDRYLNLKSFLKNNSKGYTPKKSLTLNWDQIQQFMKTAPDELYLAAKIILIFGICGALRTEEITNIKVQDVEDLGDKFLVSIHNNKNEYPRSFIIGPLYYNKVKTYISLKPTENFTDRFFVQYFKGKCTRQVIGRNKTGETPQNIATYLKLENAKRYTGHCFRRTSATLLSNSGANMTMIKQLGGWRSDNVAQGYIEHSMLNREKIFQGITHENGSTSSNIQLQPGVSNKRGNSSMMADANKENTIPDLSLSWDDFQDDFDKDDLVQAQLRHVDKKKALELTMKPTPPVMSTGNQTKILGSTIKQLSSNSFTTKQHFLSKPPVKISFQQNNNDAMTNQESSSSLPVHNQKEVCPNCLGHSNIKYENCTITNNYYYYKNDD